MNSLKSTLTTKFRENRFLYLTIFVSILFFLYFYWLNPGRPGLFPAGSWYTSWYDQSQYYKIAQGIIKNSLKMGDLSYPIGYPAIASPFVIIYPKDPFLFPDLFLFTGTIIFFFLTIKKFIKSQLAFLVILVSLIGTRLLLDMAVPWTTNVTAFAFSTLLFITLFYNKKILSFVLSGILTGYTFISRPIDAVFLIPLLISIVLAQNKLFSKIISFVFLTLTNVIFLVIFFYTNSRYSPSMFGSYFKAAGNAGIYPQGIPERIFGYFINSYTIQKETHFLGGSLLSYSILFIFIPLGIIYLFNLKRPFSKKYLLLTLSCFLVWVVTYFSLNIPVPQGLMYGALHLTTVWYPLFTLLSVTGIYSIFDNKYLKSHLKFILIYFIFISSFPFISKLISTKNLNRDSWSVTVSDNSQNATNIIDNNPYSSWDGGIQKTNNFIQVNFGKIITISRIFIETNSSASDFPKFSPSLKGSLDGITWYDISMDNTLPRDPPSSFINYPTMLTPAKFLKVTLTKDAQPAHWSISNLSIFGYGHRIFYLPNPPLSGQTLLHWFKPHY